MSEIATPTPTQTSFGAFSRFERMIAFRYLRPGASDRYVSVVASIALLGIVIGVATLIVVSSVFTGFREELLNRLLGMNGHVFAQAYDSPLTDWPDVAARITATDGVRQAIPIVEGQVLATGRRGPGLGVLLRGLRAEDARAIRMLPPAIQAGSLEDFEKGGGVAIGARMAEALGVGIGDQVRLISPEGDVTPFGTTPRVKLYPVTAIFEVGLSEYDRSIVLMPLPEAQLFLNMEGRVAGMEIFLDDPDGADAVMPAIEAAARRPLYLSDWRSRNQPIVDLIDVQKAAVTLILSLIVIIAALNIVSSLIILVKDKGRSIAVLRTIGASRGAILRIFIMAGLAIGTLGTVVGVALGALMTGQVEHIRALVSRLTGTTLFDPDLYLLTSIPTRLDGGQILFVAGLAIGLSFLATLLPAWRAATLDPIDALRYE